MKLVRFTFFINGKSVSTTPGYDTLEEVEEEGFKIVADRCIKEINQSIGLNLIELANPLDYLTFCTFIQLEYNHENNEVTEKRRLELERK
ncbi:hypothetical protein NDK25_24335 [Niallia taxi]|nr:hypothetical protein [Niallia taxi]MDE5055350.1 hypothetical protein [Niallia taxi]